MHVVNYSEVRAHLKEWMDKTWDDSSPVIIARGAKSKPVVMLSLEAYNDMIKKITQNTKAANKSDK